MVKFVEIIDFLENVEIKLFQHGLFQILHQNFHDLDVQVGLFLRLKVKTSQKLKSFFVDQSINNEILDDGHLLIVYNIFYVVLVKGLVLVVLEDSYKNKL